MKSSLWSLSSALAAVAVVFALVLGHAAILRADAPDVVRDIRPLLSDRCFFCHGPDAKNRKAGLRLDQREAALADLGKGRRAVVPGDPRASLLLERILDPDPDRRMPPPETGKELSEDEILLLRRWIEAGAPWGEHWSYRALERPPVPEDFEREVAASLRNPIDRFVAKPLAELDLTLSPPADRVTLLRRLYFDLAGLPPSAEELRGPQLEAWLAGPERDGAWEGLVDRLLAAPWFGERLAVYWLDLVRYADTVGYHGDQGHPITPYRDWVIDAFNDNLPFDRFTREQLAGDLLPEATVSSRIASGYNRLLQTTHEGGAQDKEYLQKYASDRVRNLSAVWLGATVGCAQCHDHKYDPYSQRDFYRFQAFFADLKEQGAFASPNAEVTTRAPELAVNSRLDREELLEIERELAALAGGAAEVTAARRGELEARRAALLKRRQRTMVSESAAPRPTRILSRGDWMDESGEIVHPGTPSFLPPLALEKDRRATRLDLADWLTRRDQPQTARVLVNRLWYLFFGAGLARDLEDAGSQGEPPSHPELLDWLALELIESGWNLKYLIRTILVSTTYRQTSVPSEALLDRDPENRLFGRQGRFRLPAETIRDLALRVSGLLVDRQGGGSGRPYQPAGYYAHLNFPRRKYRPAEDEAQYRRGVYTHWQRQFLHPMLKAFDAPSREECTARRPRSNTPLAALTLLNDPSFVEAARALATDLLRAGGDPAALLERAFLAVLSRRPDPTERRACLEFYERQLESYRAAPDQALRLLSIGLAPAPPGEPAARARLAAWTSVVRLLLNLAETTTRN